MKAAVAVLAFVVVAMPSVVRADGRAGSGTVVVAAGGSADMRAQQEMVFWQSISNSADPAGFQAYLEEFPNGAFDPSPAERLQPGASSPPRVDRPGPSDGPGVHAAS